MTRQGGVNPSEVVGLTLTLQVTTQDITWLMHRLGARASRPQGAQAGSRDGGLQPEASVIPNQSRRSTSHPQETVHAPQITSHRHRSTRDPQGVARAQQPMSNSHRSTPDPRGVARAPRSLSNSHRSMPNPPRATHAPHAVSNRQHSPANPQGAPHAWQVESARGDQYRSRGYTVRRATSSPLRAAPQEQGVRAVRVAGTPYQIPQRRLVHVAANPISTPVIGEGQWSSSHTLEVFEGQQMSSPLVMKEQPASSTPLMQTQKVPIVPQASSQVPPEAATVATAAAASKGREDMPVPQQRVREEPPAPLPGADYVLSAPEGPTLEELLPQQRGEEDRLMREIDLLLN